MSATSRDLTGNSFRYPGFPKKNNRRLWGIAVAVAILVNLFLVFALAQFSSHPETVIAPSMTVRTVRLVPQVSKPEQEPLPQVYTEEPHDVSEAQSEAAIDIPLPPLDVAIPVRSLPLSVLLPDNITVALNIPMNFPAFSGLGTEDLSIPGAKDGQALSATGSAQFDTAAERETIFDLDRFYPQGARQRGIEGSTRIRFRVDVNGRVSDVVVLDSSPTGVFEEAARRLALAIRYRPAQLAGKLVASDLTTTIVWTLRP